MASLLRRQIILRPSRTSLPPTPPIRHPPTSFPSTKTNRDRRRSRCGGAPLTSPPSPPRFTWPLAFLAGNARAAIARPDVIHMAPAPIAAPSQGDAATPAAAAAPAPAVPAGPPVEGGEGVAMGGDGGVGMDGMLRELQRMLEASEAGADDEP